MTEEELSFLLHERGLARVADDLLKLTAPTVRVYIRQVDEASLPAGASKIGGRPDLPAGVPWPSWHEPMAFIAQFDLAAVAPYDREDALPASGLLSFFYETDGEPLYAAMWGLPEDTGPHEYVNVDVSPSWRVLYHEDDPATFVRRDIPAGLNDAVRFPACAVHFAAEVTLPDVDGPEVRPLRLSEAERGALIELEAEVNHGTWEDGGYHLLGYPFNLGGFPLVECDVAARRVPSGWVEATPERRRRIEDEATRRWRLLLQVSSSEAAAMDWARGGVLYYCIEREALRVRDFSRVWLILSFL